MPATTNEDHSDGPVQAERSWPGLVAFVVFVVLGLTLSFSFYRHPGQTNAGAQCLRDYRQARTAADTMRVDGTRYSNGRAGPDLACGFMRRAGALPPLLLRVGTERALSSSRNLSSRARHRTQPPLTTKSRVTRISAVYRNSA